MEYGILGVLFSLFCLLLMILWALVPFAVFGIKPLLRDAIKELGRVRAELVAQRVARQQESIK